MLDREILKTDYGVSYGSVTLKSLQNDNIPELDLLVREAIQNSSDASLNEPGDSYAVNFITGVFTPKAFNEYITGLEDVLNRRYPDPTASFLEIRDTRTCGLTGKVRKNEIKKDDHGNFFKLIYDTGKRQTISVAGGNWGFGKSVYYRVGIGIVIFYSRIKTEDSYEDRLIITLVEDESKTNESGNDITLLNDIEPRSAGKAWWGRKQDEDLLPITDKESILKILEVFGSKPFKEHETGTAIIIPYIDEKRLLDGIIPIEADIEPGIKSHFVEVWASSLSDYLRLSIQKWYAPKIHNRTLPNFCKNKWLIVSVDNTPIKKQDMLPFFQLTQELYTVALAKTYSYDYKSDAFPNIELLPINVRNYFASGMTAGYIALIRISRAELNGTQNVLSPYAYIGKFEEDGGLNEPIIMYSRDPGMVIEYATTGAWVKNLTPQDSPDDFIFGFFVPITDKLIKEDLTVTEYAAMPLGEYLRECEASDHMRWIDPVRMQIVQRIQKNVINQINKRIKASALVNIDATASKLSNRLGRMLLPRIGYGKNIKPGLGSGSGSGSASGTKMHNINFTSRCIHGNEVELGYTLKLSPGKKQVALSVIIASEGGWIDASSWKEDIGTNFPVEIQECFIELVKSPISDKPIEIKSSCSSSQSLLEKEELSVELKDETQRGLYTQVVLTSHIQKPEISGHIRLKSYDKKYQFSFKVE